MEFDSWWAMPGPRRFIRRIADDLDEGRSVIVAIPAPMSDGRWGRRLAESKVTRLGDCLPTADIRTCPRPVDVITRHLLPRELDLAGMDVAAVCKEAASVFGSASYAGVHRGLTVAVLECAQSWPAWPAWADFLRDWALASRNMEIGVRIAFVAVVSGVAVSALPREEESLRIRIWDGVSSDADMLAHSLFAFADWNGTPLQRRVAASVAANLAIWDPEVVGALAVANLEDVLAPGAVLSRLGRDRGWSAASLRDRCVWEHGQNASTGYGIKLHSSVLALTGDASGIASRVWSGQVGVLLPLVEEVRQRVVGELGGMLRIPWRTQHEDITDPRDLEISHLCEQVERFELPLRPPLREALPMLRQVRNKLAHLEIVDASMLRDKRLSNPVVAGLP